MAEFAAIREVVAGAVTEVFEAESVRLRDEIIRRVLQRLQPLLESQNSKIEELNLAVAALEKGQTQGDILQALVENVVLFSGRAALFLVRGVSAAGWLARGCAHDENIRSVSIDLNAPLAQRALQERVPVFGSGHQLGAQLLTIWGEPAAGEVLVMPLVIREKVAALLCADAGAHSGARLEGSAVALLARSAVARLELLTFRKTAASSARGAPPSFSSAAPATAAAPPRKQHAVSAPAVEPAKVAGSFGAPAEAVSKPAGAASNTAAERPATELPAPASVNAAPLSGEDEELHRKARRFAKLLVDEIKLYNQAKMIEGRMKRDLYDRLKDDIEKSRATYDKRYAQTPVAAADYFTQELVRGLANSDVSLLGSNFPR
jgi:hypothetical protein